MNEYKSSHQVEPGQSLALSEKEKKKSDRRSWMDSFLGYMKALQRSITEMSIFVIILIQEKKVFKTFEN